MEGQYMAGGEPPKVRARKPKTRDRVAEGSHPQAVRKSKQPEVANWDGYAAADPNQAYPEHYGYGEDAHGYGYSGQGHGYADGTHEYGYGDGTQGWDANQGHGYTQYGDGAQDYGYAQGYDYGDGTGGYGYGDGAPGYEAPQAAKDKPKKPKKLKKPAAEGSYENQQPVQGSHQVDEYGQPLHDGYAYNAAPGPTQPHKRDPSKSRKPSNVKLLERASHSDGAYVDPSYAAHHGDGAYVDPGNGAYVDPGNGAYVDPGNGAYVDPSYAAHHGNGAYVDPGYAAQHSDGVASNAMVPYNPKGGKKSKDTASYEDFQGGSALSSRAMSRARGDDSGSARSRSSQEGPAPGRTRSSDRVKGTQARSALDEWLKQQQHHGNRKQQESLIVQPDDNKDMLETQLFGKKLAMTLPPVVENPLYQQPVQRRPPAANPDHVVNELQVVEMTKEPNPKCMACVHGVGVPITRLITRIACKQCCVALSTCGCTIL